MPRQHHQRQHRPDSLEWLSEELREEVRFVDDPDLKARIYDWLREMSDLPAGGVFDVVDNELTKVRQADDAEGMGEFAMRRLEGDGEGDFPDSCQGCEHYKTRCPVFCDPVERRRREQLQDRLSEAPSSEKRRSYRRFAEEIGCHQITRILSDNLDTYDDLRRRGLSLIEQTDVDIGYTDAADEAAQLEAEATQRGR